MTTGAQLTFLEPGLAAGALENMPLRLQFRLCGSVTFSAAFRLCSPLVEEELTDG